MSPLTSPVLAAATLLIVTGVPKLLRPERAGAALRELGLRRASVPLGRAVGLGETAVGFVALLLGGRWAAGAVAAAYLGFAAVLIPMLRRGVESCGCLGGEQTAPTWGHLVLVVVFASFGAAAAAASPVSGLLDTSTDHLGWTVMTLLFAALASWLSWVVLALLPALDVPKARQAG